MPSGMHGYTTAEARINKFKGAIISHAEPLELLGKQGRQVMRTLPMNQSETYVARRFLPFGATGSNFNSMNRFFADGTGDRTAALIQAHQVTEGITPSPDSIVPIDVTVVMQEYGCLYGWTNKTADLYEDDIPAQMKTQIGERTSLVNEQVIYGALKACTNQYYGGTGTSLSTVNGPISLKMLRRITRNMAANHARPVSKMLTAGPNFRTESVLPGYFVYIHSDASADIRDLPNFIDAKDYASGTPVPGEIGACEEFRFIMHPDLPSHQDAGAAIGSLGLFSTSGSNIDVYRFIVCAQDAYSQVALRGRSSIDATFLPVGQKTKSDAFGQRGYAGAMWRKAVMIENNGWMAVGNVGVQNLE